MQTLFVFANHSQAIRAGFTSPTNQHPIRPDYYAWYPPHIDRIAGCAFQSIIVTALFHRANWNMPKREEWLAKLHSALRSRNSREAVTWIEF